jgi:hypothetical protein
VGDATKVMRYCCCAQFGGAVMLPAEAGEYVLATDYDALAPARPQ